MDPAGRDHSAKRSIPRRSSTTPNGASSAGHKCARAFRSREPNFGASITGLPSADTRTNTRAMSSVSSRRVAALSAIARSSVSMFGRTARMAGNKSRRIRFRACRVERFDGSSTHFNPSARAIDSRARRDDLTRGRAIPEGATRSPANPRAPEPRMVRNTTVSR